MNQEQPATIPAAAAPPAARRLWNRDFALLWQGQFVSRLGAQMVAIALVFWVKNAAGSATLVGLLQMLTSLPAVLLGPFAGAFADRYSRRHIIIVGDLLRGLAALSAAALMFLAPTAQGAILGWLIGVAVVSAVISTFFEPAITAAIPDIVPPERLAPANSLSQLSAQITVFLGQGLGGTLFRLLGAPVLFLVETVTYLLAAGAALFIRIPQSVPQPSGGWRGQWAALKSDTLVGLRYVWHRPGMRRLVEVSAVQAFFTAPIVVLLPFFVEDTLGAKADWYGYILAAYGAGALLGYGAAGALRIAARQRGAWMLGLIVLGAAGYILLALTRTTGLALALAVVGGAANGFVAVCLTTLIQSTTSGEMRGRVFGLLGTLTAALTPVAMGLSGVAADLAALAYPAPGQNIRVVYVACGVATTILTLIISADRAFRDLLGSALVPPPTSAPGEPRSPGLAEPSPTTWHRA